MVYPKRFHVMPVYHLKISQIYGNSWQVTHLCSRYNIKLHGLPISNTAQVLFRIVLLDGSLNIVNKRIKISFCEMISNAMKSIQGLYWSNLLAIVHCSFGFTKHFNWHADGTRVLTPDKNTPFYCLAYSSLRGAFLTTDQEHLLRNCWRVLNIFKNQR